MELADPLQRGVSRHFNSSTCWGSKVNFFKDFTGLKLMSCYSVSAVDQEKGLSVWWILTDIYDP